MNMEQTGAVTASTEGTEREDFAKADARLDEIKGMSMGDMSDDDLENVMAERKALRAQKEEMMGAAQVEATAENQERSDAEKVAEVVKAEAEAAAQAEKAKQIEERKKADALRIEALTAEIKGESVEKKEVEITDEASAISAMVEAAREYRSNGGKDRTNYDATWAKIPASIKMGGLSGKLKIAMSADSAAEKLAKTQAETVGQASVQEKPTEEAKEVSVEKIEVAQEKQVEAPKTEMFEEYGEKMRVSADALVEVKKQMDGKMKEMNASIDDEKRKEIWKEHQLLNDKRNKLAGDAMWAPKLRSQKIGESFGEYGRYKTEEYESYRETALSDPYTVLRLAEGGVLDGESMANMSKELLSNTEYMTQILDVLPARSADKFWMNVEGDARKDKELYLAAVAKNHLNYQYGGDEWKKDPEVQKVALASGLDSMYLKK